MLREKGKLKKGKKMAIESSQVEIGYILWVRENHAT